MEGKGEEEGNGKGRKEERKGEEGKGTEEIERKE